MASTTPNQPSVTPIQIAGSGTVALILARAFSSGDRWVEIAGLAAAAVVAVALAWHERSLRGDRLKHASNVAFHETQLELAIPYVEHQRQTPEPDADPFTVPRGVHDADHVPAELHDDGGLAGVAGPGHDPAFPDDAGAPGVPTAADLEAARPTIPFPAPFSDL